MNFTPKQSKSNRTSRTLTGVLVAVAVVLAGSALVVWLIPGVYFSDDRNESGTQDFSTLWHDSSTEYDSNYVSSSLTTSSREDENMNIDEQTGSQAPMSTTTALEGRPFTVVDGVVRAKVSENLYLVSAAANNQVLVLAYVPQNADAQSDLSAGDRIALAGQIHALPQEQSMQQQWGLEADQAKSLSDEVEWYVSVTRIIPRDEIDVPEQSNNQNQ